MSDIHKLSGAYALDAVDDLERARFEQHLSVCDDCRAEVAELRETAALLAETVVTEPPASLRGSVLAGIAHVRPLAPETPQRADAKRSWFPALVAAAALVIIAGFGSVVWHPWQQDQGQQLSATEQVLQADDAARVAVDLGETGTATLVRSVSKKAAVVVAEDLAPAPEGKVYEMWYQSPTGEFLPAGLLPDGGDHTTLLDGDAATAKAAGITIEPDGGSQEPTTDPIAMFDFSEVA